MTRDDAYDLIDRFLRNECDDNLYAEFSEALELCFTDEALRQQLAAAQTEISELHTEIDDCHKRMLAGQSHNVMLRDALHAIAIEIATENLSAITVLKKCFRMADEALAATKPKEDNNGN